MFVNKYTIVNSEETNTTGYTLNIPVSQNNGFVGQQEIIDTKFVDVEVEKAVNITFDYEKVKLLPKISNNIVDSVTYTVNFLGSTGFVKPSYWGNISSKPEERFDLSDFKFKKKAFTQSFLRLDFYDSDIATNQNLVSFVTLYPKFSYSDINSANIAKQIGNVPDPNTYPVQFKLGNTMVDRRENGEGFALYYFKDEIVPTILGTPPKYLYMRATFNNAKDGKTTGLMASNVSNLSIDDLMKTTKDIIPPGSVKNNLYTRYILIRDSDGYFYEIDTTYSNNVTTSGSNEYTVDLYQISAK